MAKLLKLRRGTTSQHSSFTGAEGEVTVDTTKDTLVVHDGSTAGGHPLQKESSSLSLIDEDNMATDSATRPPSQQSVKAYIDAKVPTSITVADESSDTTCFPLFVTAATGDLAPKTGTNFTFNSSTGKVVIGGDLQVQGTTTTVDSTTLTVADKNIEIAKGAADDAAADGAGITVDSGDGDKTWNWVDATDAWTSSEHIHVPDDKKLIVGTGSDLQIYHDGSNSHITNATGHVELNSSWRWADNARVRCGASSDLELYHDGSNSYIIDQGTGELIIQGSVTKTRNDQGHVQINASNDVVELYYDNTKKFETTSAGVTVSGSITDDLGNVRGIPATTKSSAHTLVAGDAGKVVYISTGGVTIPNSVMSGGDVVTIINNSGSDQTLTQASGLTLHNTADAATGNRTLAGRGMATVWFQGGSTAYISGAGLS